MKKELTAREKKIIYECAVCKLGEYTARKLPKKEISDLAELVSKLQHIWDVEGK